jgi:hypothetical protein
MSNKEEPNPEYNWKSLVGTITISKEEIEKNLIPDKAFIEQMYKSQIKELDTILIINILLDELLGEM